MKVIVTGCAGFIGMHTALRLLSRGDEVIGIDNLNPYYDPRLKHARLAKLATDSKFRFVQADIADSIALTDAFALYKPQSVVHLAAQAGVRHSISNPGAYVQSNLVGFGNILECARNQGVEHLVYASSSSVYGANTKVPFSERDNVDHPVSLYAASKKANELMAHSYSHLYGLPTTGLRFFTVYGPWGRPDMSPWLFTSAILEGRPIDVFNYGKMRRDFTYIDDIVEGTVRVLDNVPQPAPDHWNLQSDPPCSKAPYRVYNIGNHTSVALMDFIGILEMVLGREARKNFLPMQAGDVMETYADVSRLRNDVGFEPATSLESGLQRWVQWYKWYTGLLPVSKTLC